VLLKKPRNKSVEVEDDQSHVKLIDTMYSTDLTHSALAPSNLTDGTHQDASDASPMDVCDVTPVSMGIPYVAGALEDASNASMMISPVTVHIEPAITPSAPDTSDQLNGSCMEPCGNVDINGEPLQDEQDDDHETLAENEFRFEKTGTFLQPPSIAEAEVGHEGIKLILKPPRKNGLGYDHHNLDELTFSHLQAMKQFLWKYIDERQTSGWLKVSLEVAQDHERGPHHARWLREWTCAFLADRNDLSINVYGSWNVWMLDDEDLAQAIHLHLQSLGPYVRAQDVIDFVKLLDTMTKFKLKKSISLATAQRWING
jgi:hypothetical protein